MKNIKLHLLTIRCLIMAISLWQYAYAEVLTPAVTQKNIHEIKVPLLAHERWWGGAVHDGEVMPYQEGFSYDMYGDNKGNQVQPLLISNKGRVIWSEDSFKFTFSEGAIIIEARGKIEQNQAGSTLKEAFIFASKNHFPANGKMPDELLFSAPQYNTWIELIYNQNQEDILKYAHDIIDNGLPPGVLMIDDNWQEAYGKWNFHPGRFPDPKGMIKELHQLGFKVMLWVCPFVSPDTDLYRSLAQKGLLLKNPKEVKILGKSSIKNGQPAMIYWWNGVSALLDLSNPDAEQWFKGELKKLVDEFDVDGFKLDAGDSPFYPDGLISHKKDITPNEHTRLFGKIGLDFPLNEYRAMWKMAGLPLAQRLRDKWHTWKDLKTLIPNITAQGLVGYAFTCPDMIGGGEFHDFLDTKPKDQNLIVRSAQTHALMPMMQFSVAPWRILDEKHLQAVKKAVALRKQFTPTIVGLAKEAARTGEPIVRTLEYVFPGEGFENVKTQFMLGDDILVAPILNKEGKRLVKLPKGQWMDYDGKKLRGGTELSIEVPLDVLPYFKKIKQ